MDRDYLQDALMNFNGGNWYSWKKEDDNGNKIPNSDQRMCNTNVLEIIKDGATMPTKAEVDAKIQELKDAETNAINKKASGKQKLLDLGLTEEEVKALIGV
jgi:hypothetical protein